MPSPEPIEPQSSPLWPQDLIDIFIRPGKFFSSQLALGKTPYILLVTWCFGMAEIMHHIDQNILRAEMGRSRAG
jgi:Yip1 domain